MRRAMSHRRAIENLLLESNLPNRSTLSSACFAPSRARLSPAVEGRLPGFEAWRLTARQKRLPKARVCKRLTDVALAVTLIVVLAPAMALIALAVKMDGGPAFYVHRRVGCDGRPFRCLKFRSMVIDADQALDQLLAQSDYARQEWEGGFKLRLDPRVTAVGRFLRGFSLDELPQLFNVVTGTMSLVGPRPIVEAEIGRYGADFLAYCSCRPGITGLWQVHGRSDVDYARRIELDRLYAREWSLLLDLTILLKTVIVVTRRHGAY
jgi:lipopolysaccharide/colanic/teichoic acid biosynthesis glycosyltransferase